MSSTYAPCTRCEIINRVPLGRARAETPVCGNCGTALPVESGVVHVNGTSLQHLIDLSGRMQLPVLTDFWAPWCVPCHAFKIPFEKAAARMADQLVFTSLNSMENAIAADVHGIKTLPTLVVFRNGGEIARHFGAIPEERLIAWLREVLGSERARAA